MEHLVHPHFYLVKWHFFFTGGHKCVKTLRKIIIEVVRMSKNAWWFIAFEVKDLVKHVLYVKRLCGYLVKYVLL